MNPLSQSVFFTEVAGCSPVPLSKIDYGKENIRTLFEELQSGMRKIVLTLEFGFRWLSANPTKW